MDIAKVSELAIARYNPDREFYRLVVVRSDPNATEVFKRMLEMLGHEVATANDGRLALDLIRRVKPDIVLTATDLAGMSGFELAREVRRTMPEPPLLVAHSGYTAAELRAKDPNHAFDEWLFIVTRLEDFAAVFKTFRHNAVYSPSSIERADVSELAREEMI